MTFTQTKWSLTDLYPGFNTPEFESAFDTIEEQVTSFEGLRANLTPEMPADRFLDIVRASEEMTRVAIKLDAFAGLAFAADTQDQTALSAQAREDLLERGSFACISTPDESAPAFARAIHEALADYDQKYPRAVTGGGGMPS